MRNWIFVLLSLPGMALTAQAASAAGGGLEARQKAIIERMKLLAPNERVEQRCNVQALSAIGRGHKGFRPDEIIAYAFAEIAIKNGHVVARGAAFRNRGEWYRLSYQCQTGEEGLSIVSFSYTMGERVPREQWAEHYLVPQ